MPALTPQLKPPKSARSIFWKNRLPLQKLLSAVERALKHGEVQTASGMTLDKLGNSPVIQEMNGSIEAAAKHNRPLLLAGEAGSPFEIVARYLHKSGTPWVATDRVEHIVARRWSCCKRSSGGILYVGDIARYSKNIQNGIAFLAGESRPLQCPYDCFMRL